MGLFSGTGSTPGSYIEGAVIAHAKETCGTCCKQNKADYVIDGIIIEKKYLLPGGGKCP